MTETGLRDAPSGAGSPDAPARSGASGITSEQAAFWVFVAFLAISAYALLLHLGHYFWFLGDEWDYLVTRNGGSLADLLRPHNEHLQPLPILAYRLLWNIFGLRSYLPYQIPVIALHLTGAALLRMVIRRCGVNVWIATAAAAVFVLFGPGEENIVWAFQIGFTGSFVFGLAQLLLADHDGENRRRDWIALGMGAIGLLCSGFTPIIVAVVGVVVLVRRGWRPALFQTVPLAVIYGTWWLAIGPDQIKDPYHRPTDFGEVLHFVWVGLSSTFRDLGGNRFFGILLAVLLVAGLVVAWAPLPRRERLRQAVTPAALFLAGILFLTVSGYGRWWINSTVGQSSRYVYLVAGFSLPAIAVALDALTRRWRGAYIVAVVLLVSAIPHNIGQFDTLAPFDGAYFAARRETIAALARSPYATQVPRSTRPDLLTSDVNVGWLLDALHDGKLPDLRNPADAHDPTFRLRFGLAVLKQPVPPGAKCDVIRKPVDVSLRKGDELGVKVGPWTKPKSGWFYFQSYRLQLLKNGAPIGSPMTLHPDNGHRLRAQLDHLDVRVSLFPGTESLILCR